MSWCRLEDDMDENRKLRRLSDPAFRLYWCAVTWSRRHQTGGRLYDDDVTDLCARQRLRNPKVLVDELLEVPYDYEAGLWERVAPGLYQIHHHGHYNPLTSKERMKLKRERDRASQGDDDVTPGDVTGSSPGPPDMTPGDGGVTGAVAGCDAPSRARHRAGYPDPVPEPVPVTPVADAPSVTPLAVPPEGNEQTGTAGDGLRAFLAALNTSTGRPTRETAKVRSLYLERLRDGYAAADLEAAARGVPLSKHHMGLNDLQVPLNDAAHVLGSSMLDALIGLGRGEISAVRPATPQEQRDGELADWARERGAQAARELPDVPR